MRPKDSKNRNLEIQKGMHIIMTVPHVRPNTNLQIKTQKNAMSTFMGMTVYSQMK